MPRKSNKTSYVMNLITNGEPGGEGQQGAEGEELQEQIPEAPAPDTSNQSPGPLPQTPEPETRKVVVVDEDQESERLSEEIRGQLEQQLASEMQEQAFGAKPEGQPLEQEIMGDAGVSAEMQGMEAAPERAATEREETIMDTEMNTAPEAMTMNEAADTAAGTENTGGAADGMADMAATAEGVGGPANTAVQSGQPDYRMVNVMETLVARVNLDKYIREYGVCTCPRCRADVHALILTTLPSKYVVMNEASVSPLLNFYESRKKTDIFTATLNACLEVKEHPRHDGTTEKW